MKRSALLLTGILMLVWAASAIAEPIAPLATLTDFGKQFFAAEGKTEADAKKDIPSRELVGVPAYPGSHFGVLGGDGTVDGSSVQLISKDSPEKVIDWYRKQLGKDWQYVPDLAAKQMNEVGVFAKTRKKNIDALNAFRYKLLRVSKVEKPGDIGHIDMLFDVKGIKSLIVITFKPAM